MFRCLFILLAALAPGSLLAQLELKIDPVKVAGGEVRFETNPSTSGIDASSLQAAGWHTIAEGRFRVLLDRTKIQNFENQGFFNYDLFIQPAEPIANNSPPGILVKVQATPVGDFTDALTDVTLHVRDGVKRDFSGSDRINIPVHSFGGKDFFTHADTQVEDVYLGITRNIELELKNSLADIPLVIKPGMEVHYSQNLWDYTLIPDPGSIRAQSSKTVATLQIKPRFWPAVNAALFPISSTSEHDTVKVSFRYYSDFGGQERDGKSTIRLRIAAPFLLLLAVSAIGSLIGAVVAFLLPSDPSGQTKKRISILVAILLSIIGESIATLISLTNSKIVVFGLDLDARQILPAFVLGVLIGLYGYRSADKYGEILGLKLPKA